MTANGQMKKALRALLPKEQYESLARLSRRFPRKDPLLRIKQMIQHEGLSDTSLIELRNGINVTGKMDYAPHDIYLHVDSLIEYETRLHSCRKEPDTVKWVEDFMKPGDIFYDIGANVGAYSLVAAKCFAGQVKVYAFEPAFLNFSQLCRNIFLNKCQDTIFPLSVALSDKTSIDDLNFHDLVTGGSLHTLGETIDHKGEAFTPVATQRMLSFRLDDLIHQFKIPTPSHIKIDVDGIEKAVLEGAERALSNPSLRSIDVELPEGEREITELLLAKGFKLHSQHQRWTPGMLNCVFARNS